MSTDVPRIIIGIDPGSRITGYGIIQINRSQHQCLTFGCIKTGDDAINLRLQKIYSELCDIIKVYRPHEAALESIFTGCNYQSALKLGQARGAALLATAIHALPVSEYSARHIKKSIVGYGAASKMQVQNMISALLHLKQKPLPDAADALAIALCHAHHWKAPVLSKDLPV